MGADPHAFAAGTRRPGRSVHAPPPHRGAAAFVAREGALEARPVYDPTDTDSDGVIDMIDQEKESPAGARVDPRGVTLDSDMDKVMDYKDKEPFSPPGYTVELAGGGEDQAEAFGDLFKALGASILLAYLLMAVLYNSFTHPLVILFSLPVAVAGAMFGLLVFNYTFSVFSMIGLILLVGLAIKNGILLVDRTNHNRERGMTTHDALIEAGPARLRPIIMTSITIALALFPTALGLGEGTEIRAPLAATVLGGVISSTALTLLLIPVVYSLFDSVPGLVQRILAFTGILALFPQRPPKHVVQAGDSGGDGA